MTTKPDQTLEDLAALERDLRLFLVQEEHERLLGETGASQRANSTRNPNHAEVDKQPSIATVLPMRGVPTAGAGRSSAALHRSALPYDQLPLAADDGNVLLPEADLTPVGPQEFTRIEAASVGNTVGQVIFLADHEAVFLDIQVPEQFAILVIGEDQYKVVALSATRFRVAGLDPDDDALLALEARGSTIKLI